MGRVAAMQRVAGRTPLGYTSRFGESAFASDVAAEAVSAPRARSWVGARAKSVPAGRRAAPDPRKWRNW